MTDIEYICRVLEACILTSKRPLDLKDFKRIFEGKGVTEEEITDALNRLFDKYNKEKSGIVIRNQKGRYFFTNSEDTSEFILRMDRSLRIELSRAAWEVLSILCFRQPITRAEIDEIRGVDSSTALRTLLEHGLVRIAGRKDTPGRPALFKTTDRVLSLLNIESLDELYELQSIIQKESEGTGIEIANERLIEELIGNPDNSQIERVRDEIGDKILAIEDQLKQLSSINKKTKDSILEHIEDREQPDEDH